MNDGRTRRDQCFAFGAGVAGGESPVDDAGGAPVPEAGGLGGGGAVALAGGGAPVLRAAAYSFMWAAYSLNRCRAASWAGLAGFFGFAPVSGGFVSSDMGHHAYADAPALTKYRYSTCRFETEVPKFRMNSSPSPIVNWLFNEAVGTRVSVPKAL